MKLMEKHGVNLFLVVLAGAFAGIYLTSNKSSSCLTRGISERSTASGQAASSATAKTTVGARAPTWELPDLDGNLISSESFRGDIVVLNFWATWCPPCRAELPDFVEAQAAYREKGVSFIGVSVDMGAPEHVREFVENYGLNYPVVMATAEIVGDYGNVEAIPTTFFIGRDGRIADMQIGGMDGSMLRAKIDRILKNRT